MTTRRDRETAPREKAAARRSWVARAVAVSMASVALAGSAGCAGSTRSVPRMGEMDRVRDSRAAKEGRELAPQVFARAEEERALARKAYDGGDDLAAQIYADRAIAAYAHAFVLSRLARATRELDAASQALTATTDEAQKLAASRLEVERDGEELDKQLKVARVAALPAPGGPMDPAHEGARRVAARALATDARLLCGSARLLLGAGKPVENPESAGRASAGPASADTTGGDAALAGAENELSAVEAQLDAVAKAAPIDAAGRARARCLSVLTRIRRASKEPAGRADALLAEISASAGFDPSRDERGVVVTLRDLFARAATGTTAGPLTPAGDAKLQQLGRVAAAHAGVAVQVVIHDATPPGKGDGDADLLRGDAAVKALVAGGAPAARVKAESAGARAPLVDPSDAAHRARNARVDVVFVVPST